MINEKNSYVGARWYKCDLHLHTTASLCFRDRNVTPKQWVDKAIQEGLNCVAVTDHNTGALIDEIKEAAQGSALTVFPGVEITCDSSKIHLLVLFDTDKGSDDIRDFLVRADIPAKDFSEQTAGTQKSIFEIVKLAEKDGALVIPAHIDEYNGLESVSSSNLDEFFSLPSINAVQVVHKEFTNVALSVSKNQALLDYLNDYYNTPNPLIAESVAKNWHKPVKKALENNLAILTFSDNPHEPKNSKHGLWGIGKNYSWIKMDEIPSLEGLRQAFLMHKHRVRNDFESPQQPYSLPELWIKSVKVLNTTITGSSNPLKIEFSPQLNALIGGRGSGKSSVLRFIRGVFNRTMDLEELEDILNDHNDFYKLYKSREKKGVFTNDSVIEIEFVRHNILHQIVASNINNSVSQKVEVKRIVGVDGSWEVVTDEGYLDFFEFEHYSQKQIYQIAQEPNALRERTDRAIRGLNELKDDREKTKTLFLEKSASIRTMENTMARRRKIETNLNDVNKSIERIQQSGISGIVNERNHFSSEQVLIEEFNKEITKKEFLLKDTIESLKLEPIDFFKFREEYKSEIEGHSNEVIKEIEEIRSKLMGLKELISSSQRKFDSSVHNSNWNKDFIQNTRDFSETIMWLEEEATDSISDFDKLIQEKKRLEDQLKSIDEIIANMDEEVQERKKLQKDYLDLSKNITSKRREFVNNVLKNDKVKIEIKPFRNKSDFEDRLRQILQKEESFQSDIDSLLDRCFKTDVEKGIKEFREIFLKMRRRENVGNIVQGRFSHMVTTLSDPQIDEIELLLPEDEIEIQYKPKPNSNFKSLATASAGQKTTAVLTFILSYGNHPLILDQPEDDLDNRLVYELIVDRLSEAKKNRQLIVVTHNANIPVNGDAEYIVSMNTESKFLEVLHTGTVEQTLIKKEICDVMEGGEQAFDMRSRRYKLIQK